MTYSKGPVQIDLTHEPIFDRAETVNKDITVITHGFRARIKLTFDIGDTMSDHTHVREIVNALMDGATVVSISLDNGAIYKEVRIRSYDGPNPWNARPGAGARFVLEVDTVAVMPTIPAIGAGAWAT